jgi:hypothetical protein
MRSALLPLVILGSFVLPGLMLWSCGGELPGPQSCSDRDPCQKGRICALGRCRKKGTVPVSTKAEKLTFQPEDLAWIHGSSIVAPSELGPTIRLGKRGDHETLLMRYAIELPEKAKVQRALLVLDPMPECAPRPGRIALELAHVLSPWRSAELTRGSQPRLDLPMRLADMRATPAQALRIDVTEIVRRWAKHRKRYHGVALIANGASDTGACFTTGLTWGEGPRLQIFLRPDQPADAGTDADAEAGADADTDAGDAGDAES